MELIHKSVLFDESIESLNIKPDGIYVDGTLGGAGHSQEILRRLGKGGLLLCLDQDPFAVRVSKERLDKVETEGKYQIENVNFQELERVCQKHNIEKIDGLLLDLGVSSFQLDDGERGFSYQKDARLDMRMNSNAKSTAEDMVNEYTENELKRVIRDYGEEKWAGRIAKFIVDHRTKKRIETTFELVDIIKAAIPSSARREGPHPAKRTFQAIRIELNQEMQVLENVIRQGGGLLRSGGRMSIISFHSLEDRIVKVEFLNLVNPCKCPSSFPICVCGQVSKGKLWSKKPIVPTAAELEENPRARSQRE